MIDQLAEERERTVEGWAEVNLSSHLWEGEGGGGGEGREGMGNEEINGMMMKLMSSFIFLSPRQ